MRITYLLERADQLWGGVKIVLEDANWLTARGHDVTVVARSGPPDWIPLDCGFVQVPAFERASIPSSDVCVGTFFTTVPYALMAEAGAVVHFCQGYEGGHREFAPVFDQIRRIYALPGLHHVTIAPHLTRLLRDEFGIEATEIPQAVDHMVHFPVPAGLTSPIDRPRVLRVGLVGPAGVPGKGIPIGIEACARAHAAGVDLELVRATNAPEPGEGTGLPFPVRIHTGVLPERMGAFYRSLDVLLGPATSPAEGFYLPAVEAMACGVPCVLSDVDCFRGYAARSDYARFATTGDPRAFARGLVELALDGGLRARLRDRGLETAARFTRDAHGEALERAFERALGAAGASYEPAFSSRAPSGVSTTT